MDGEPPEGPRRLAAPPKHWDDSLQENLLALGTAPHKGAQRKRFVHGVEAKDACDWVIAAKNMSKWHIGAEKGVGEFEDAWRRADRRESIAVMNETLLRRGLSIEE